jgi:translation initiation factor IF-2
MSADGSVKNFMAVANERPPERVDISEEETFPNKGDVGKEGEGALDIVPKTRTRNSAVAGVIKKKTVTEAPADGHGEKSITQISQSEFPVNGATGTFAESSSAGMMANEKMEIFENRELAIGKMPLNNFPAGRAAIQSSDKELGGDRMDRHMRTGRTTGPRMQVLQPGYGRRPGPSASFTEPQHEAPKQSLLKSVDGPSAERPRMVPLERLQGALQGQKRRWGSYRPGGGPSTGSGSGDRWHGGAPFGQRGSRPGDGAQSGNGAFGDRGRGRDFRGDRPGGTFAASNSAPGNGPRRQNDGFRGDRGNFGARTGGNSRPERGRWAGPNVRGFPQKAAPSIPATARRPSKSQPNAGTSGGAQGNVLSLKLPRSVRELAPDVGLKPFQIISELMRMGIFASMNYVIDESLARRLGERFEFQFEVQKTTAASKAISIQPKANAEVRNAVLATRPPVVCVLGHVDHGKTTLLDNIRKTNVVSGEAGGITQHIGAYEIILGDKSITFIDTPGHAAFSKMRERGANITDIAILTVAADDGFMPQTDEALNFVQRAGVPIIVAINKIDAKGANVDRVKQQMQQRGIAPEDWGGATLCQGVSAIKGDGLKELLELVLVQAEMLELNADYGAPAQGVVIESQMEIGRGPTASVIIQDGTLRVGDAVVCGEEYCKVRAMLDDNGKTLTTASPAKPCKIIGWSGAVDAGSIFAQVRDEKEARQLADESRADAVREGSECTPSGYRRSSRRLVNRSEDGVEALFAAINAKQKCTLPIVIKGDVQGSVEALEACLRELPQDKIGLDVVRAEIGSVVKNDVEFAQSAGATIVAFNVKAENGVQALLKQHGIHLIQHNIIYELIGRVRDAMAELLEPEIREEKFGAAQVRQVFRLSKYAVAGCMVTEGKIVRESDALFRVHRGGKILFDGKISSLRRAKEDVTEVRAGFECGIALAGFEGHQSGDIIECYKVQKIRPSL